jgi:hypothetical protein
MKKNKEYVYQSRIAICEPRTVGEFNQFGFAGVLICPKGQSNISESDDWENIQCEITIRPIKSLGVAKLKNMRLDQVALTLGDDKSWVKNKKDE